MALQKERVWTVGEMEQESRAPPTSASVGKIHAPWLTPFFAILHMSVNDWESAVSVDVEITDTFQWVGEFANTESTNNEDLLKMFRSTTNNVLGYVRSMHYYSLFYWNLNLTRHPICLFAKYCNTSQRVNIFNTVGHTVSVPATQLCLCRMKTIKDNM